MQLSIGLGFRELQGPMKKIGLVAPLQLLPHVLRNPLESISRSLVYRLRLFVRDANNDDAFSLFSARCSCDMAVVVVAVADGL